MSAQVIDLANRFPGKYRREDPSIHTEDRWQQGYEAARTLYGGERDKVPSPCLFCAGAILGFLLAVMVTRL